MAFFSEREGLLKPTIESSGVKAAILRDEGHNAELLTCAL